MSKYNFLNILRAVKKFIRSKDKKIKRWRRFIISLITVGIPTVFFYLGLIWNDEIELLEYKDYLELQHEWAEFVRNKDFENISNQIEEYEGEQDFINLYLLYKLTYDVLLIANPNDPSIYFYKIDPKSYFFYDAALMLNLYYKKYCCGSLWEAKMDELLTKIELTKTHQSLLYFLKSERYQNDKAELQELYKNLQLIYHNHFNFKNYSLEVTGSPGDKFKVNGLDYFIMPPTLAYIYLQNMWSLFEGSERTKLLGELNKLISNNKARIDKGLGEFWIQNPFFYPVNYEIFEPHEGTIFYRLKTATFQLNEPILECAEMYYVTDLNKKLINRGLLNKKSTLGNFKMSIDHQDFNFIVANRFQIISTKNVMNYWSNDTSSQILIDGECPDVESFTKTYKTTIHNVPAQ